MKTAWIPTLLLSTALWAQNVNLIPTAPAPLSSIAPKVFDLTLLAKMWVTTITEINAAISLGLDLGFDPDDADVVLADGVFAEEVGYCSREYYDHENWEEKPGYQECQDAWNGAYDDHDELQDTPAFWQFMYAIYTSKELQNVAYDWLTPVFRDTFRTVSPERKRVLCSMVEHGRIYASDLLKDRKKIECETQYLASEMKKVDDSKKEGVDRMDRYYAVFHWYRPNGTCDGPKVGDSKEPPFRKLEAWIYRRVVSKQMTAEQIRDWMLRIYGEILVCYT